MNQFSSKLSIPNEHVKQNLSNLISHGKLNTKILSNAAKIDEKWLQDYIQGSEVTPLPENESHYLTDLTDILTFGMDTDINQRLNAVFDVLIQVYEMDIKTLAKCAEIKEEIIVRFMHSSEDVCMEEKYELAVKVMFLYYILMFPDYSKC